MKLHIKPFRVLWMSVALMKFAAPPTAMAEPPGFNYDESKIAKYTLPECYLDFADKHFRPNSKARPRTPQE